jgi:hypothetical protein
MISDDVFHPKNLTTGSILSKVRRIINVLEFTDNLSNTSNKILVLHCFQPRVSYV